MKLNLLIFSLLGVSVSASGIRGFTPIKGSERRLASSSTKTSKKGDKDTTVELSSSGRVIECTGKDCKRFIALCTGDGDDGLFRGVGAFDESTSSDSGSGNSRRLKKTSSSSDDEVAVFRVKDVEDCVLTKRTSGGGSSSSSSSSDDTTRAVKKTKRTTTETTQPPETKKTKKSSEDETTPGTKRVLHNWRGRRRRSSSSSSRGNTRIVVNYGGGLVRCSGTSCTSFIDHCTDGHRHVRNFHFTTTSSGKSRRLKKSSSSSGDNIRLVTYDVVNPDECAYVEHYDRWPTYYPRYYGRTWTRGWSGRKWRGRRRRSTSSKSRKLRRVLHSSSSSSKEGKKADTRIKFTSRGDFVECSGKNCKRFINLCTDGKKHLKTFDLKYLDGSTTKSSGKSRRLKKSSSGNNIHIRFIDMDSDGCILV